MLIGVLPLVLVGALAYGLNWLRKHDHLPYWLQMARAYLDLGQAYVELVTAAVVRPFLAIGSSCATVRGWGRALMRMFGGGDE
jgi:hypothetical protein